MERRDVLEFFFAGMSCANHIDVSDDIFTAIIENLCYRSFDIEKKTIDSF